MKKLLTLTAAVLFFAGCSPKNMAIGVVAGAVNEGLPATLEEEDLQTGKETMLSLLKLLETLQRNKPGDEELLNVLAQGYCGYAIMFVEDENPKRAALFYARGMNYAKMLLENKSLLEDGNVNYSKIKNSNAPALFWYTFCQASYVQSSISNPDAAAMLSKVEEQLDTLIKIAPDFYYRTAYSMKGAILSARPKALGGNPELAKQNFEKALETQGAQFLLNKYMYARFYATSVLDEDLFAELLGEIINADPALKEQNLANLAAKEKAKLLLEKTNELF